VILAAGVGSRLRPITDSTPKCLVPVAGRPVLGWQLDALARASVADVTVVAGYRADDVTAYCRSFGDHVSVVTNADYDKTNNMYSFRLALQGRAPDDVLLCNGDVVFDDAIARGILEQRHPNLIAAQPGQYLEESMKIRVDDDGRVTALSKAIAEDDAFGVSIDLYRFSADAVAAIDRAADRMIDHEGNASLWTEVAIEAVLPEVPVRPFDIGARRWIEIDTLDDLAAGERMFGRTSP
jgi:choline kinase